MTGLDIGNENYSRKGREGKKVGGRRGWSGEDNNYKKRRRLG